MKKVQLLGLMLLAVFFAFQGISHAEESLVKAETKIAGVQDEVAVEVKTEEKKAEDILAAVNEGAAVPVVAADASVKN